MSTNEKNNEKKEIKTTETKEVAVKEGANLKQSAMSRLTPCLTKEAK